MVTINPNSKFIKLKNLNFSFQYPNIIDLKLGMKIKPKSMSKYNNNTTISHKVRINGFSVKQFP